jgi:hypothetical protein
VVILAGLWIRKRPPIAPDLLSKLVLALFAVALLATLNLNGSGLGAALGGLVFIGLPLLWFFVGRELGDQMVARALLIGTLVLGVLIAAYGLWQTQVGLPSWDARWLAVAGYNSLYIHHGNEYTIRAFGTFASAAEYATYLGVAIAIATAFLLHRRWRPALALPVLAVALVFASGRTVLVLTVLAILVMCALRSRRPRLALSLVGGTVVLGVVVFQLGGPAMRDATTKLNSPLLSHLAEGLAHPLDPNRSTLVQHWVLMRDGIVDSVDQPLGFGTASTNIASSEVRSGAPSRNTEVDVANAFVSLGVVGGVLLLLVIGLAIQRVASAYRATREPLLLAVAGLLIVSLGQWLNGGHYALAPLIWFLVGYSTAEWRRAASRDGATVFSEVAPGASDGLAAAGHSQG